ncbi:MAG: BppU family phage baseplate upper protein [Thiomicrorhabdus sp.]|nr:BppU family phage baseplate upper protein [Thiomicrorhabdus sp.]
MARTDINRYRGDTKDLVMKLTQDKTVFSLTGFSAVLGVNSEENPTEDNCVFKSTATVDAATGTLTFPFAVEDVDLVGDFYYDVELTDGAAKTSTIRKGKMVFAQDITK